MQGENGRPNIRSKRALDFSSLRSSEEKFFLSSNLLLSQTINQLGEKNIGNFRHTKLQKLTKFSMDTIGKRFLPKWKKTKEKEEFVGSRKRHWKFSGRMWTIGVSSVLGKFIFHTTTTTKLIKEGNHMPFYLAISNIFVCITCITDYKFNKILSLFWENGREEKEGERYNNL